MIISKTTNFDASLLEAGSDMAYVTFNGSVDAQGKPNITFYIVDMYLYMKHVSEFQAAFTQFRTEVFDYSNEMLKAPTLNKEA